jgi:hypothetical protein
MMQFDTGIAELDIAELDHQPNSFGGKINCIDSTTVVLIYFSRHDEVSKYLCGRGATLVLDEFEAGVRMCQVRFDTYTSFFLTSKFVFRGSSLTHSRCLNTGCLC